MHYGVAQTNLWKSQLAHAELRSAVTRFPLATLKQAWVSVWYTEGKNVL